VKLLIHQAEELPRTTIVLFVAQVDELTARALAFGKSLAADRFEAVTLTSEATRQQHLRRDWQALGADVPLVVVSSRLGGFMQPAAQYVRSLAPGPDHTVVVIIPQLVAKHRYKNVFRNRSALRLKATLLKIPWVVVITLPLHLEARPGTGISGPAFPER
jgi:hypothetical protein